MAKPQHWAVSVDVDGENVLTIESNCLSGVENIEDHEETIRTAALHLLSFIGDPPGTRGFGSTQNQLEPSPVPLPRPRPPELDQPTIMVPEH